MLPTTPRECSRSMNTSTTRSSSRIATRVSCGVEEITISLFIRLTPASQARPAGQQTCGHAGECACHRAHHHPQEDEQAVERHVHETRRLQLKKTSNFEVRTSKFFSS